MTETIVIFALLFALILTYVHALKTSFRVAKQNEKLLLDLQRDTFFDHYHKASHPYHIHPMK